MEHEAAKIIGAPPGYLGHRETQPIFTQAKVNAVSSTKSPFSIILFDEIEKAHPGVWRAILGILDKATLRLGDNTQVNFEKCVIFLSSNVGAKEISNLLEPHFGFDVTASTTEVTEAQQKAIEKIGLGSMSKKFPPEFENRVDEIITYRNLNHDTLSKITDMELRKIQTHIAVRLGPQAFTFAYGDDTLEFLTTTGTSIKYGARELKRTLGRHILNPLADDFVDGRISPNSIVSCRVDTDHIVWDITEARIDVVSEPAELEAAAAAAAAANEGSSVRKTRRAKTSG
jgi:ATP-dependent Clp protease ATP-binding subunit ClpA